MELQNLSYTGDIEPGIYLKTIIAVSLADGILHENEKNFINMQAQLFAIDPTPFWNDPEQSLDFLHEITPSKATCFSIIRDCLTLGYIDGDFSETERQKVFQIASRLQLSEDDVISIEDWLKEFWRLLEKGKQLFEIGVSTVKKE